MRILPSEIDATRFIVQNGRVKRPMLFVGSFLLAVAATIACGSKTNSAGSGSASGSGSAGSAQLVQGSAGSATAPQEHPGQKPYLTYCALCHGPAAKGYAADNAPSLVNKTLLESADPGFIAAGIAQGRPGTPMAPYSKKVGGPLDDAQIAAIVSYVQMLGGNPPAVPAVAVGKGDAKAGQAIYDANCKKCHGDQSGRLTAIHLANQTFLQTASDSFIHYAIANGRPGTPMEAWGKVLTDSQRSDVVAYIRSWQGAPVIEPKLAAPTGKEPVVINPEGKAPSFTLREDRFVPAAQVVEALKQKKKLVIIDARPASEWSRGHIPGAVAIPHYEAGQLDRVPNDGTWVLAYCACPHHASGIIVDELRKRGYKNTAVIDEGILYWKQQGYPMAVAPAVSGGAGSGATSTPMVPQ